MCLFSPSRTLINSCNGSIARRSTHQILWKDIEGTTRSRARSGMQNTLVSLLRYLNLHWLPKRCRVSSQSSLSISTSCTRNMKRIFHDRHLWTSFCMSMSCIRWWLTVQRWTHILVALITCQTNNNCQKSSFYLRTQKTHLWRKTLIIFRRRSQIHLQMWKCGLSTKSWRLMLLSKLSRREVNLRNAEMQDKQSAWTI